MQSGECSSEISNSTLIPSATKPESEPKFEFEPKPELPSNWLPFICTRENLEMVWNKLNQFPILFDDDVRGDFKSFIIDMTNKNSVIFLTGNYGICEICNIVPYRGCDVHLTFWDRRFRGRDGECRAVIKWIFNTLQLHRITVSTVSIAHSTINFIKALGFRREGVIRESYPYKGRLLDVHIFGLLRDEVLLHLAKEENLAKEEVKENGKN